MLETILFEKDLGQIGAGTGTQTLGLFLGKEALYQLSYTRKLKWWRLLDSNQRHEALQATALPAELRRHRRSFLGLQT